MIVKPKPSNLLCIEDMSLTYYPGFYDAEVANHFYNVLVNQIAWNQEYYKMFGKKIPSPRLVAWYGDVGASYSYSGITHTPLYWLPELLEIKQHIQNRLNLKFNSVLANLYRNESDSMGYHADNEPELGEEPVIASLTLGAERRFNFKHKKKKILHKMQLDNGSLLIMSGQTQEQWLHAVPKQKQPTAARINLTFRLIQG